MKLRRTSALHLSHGSIRDDSRVCKIAVAAANGVVAKVCVVGVRSRAGQAAPGRHEPHDIDEISLWTGVFRGLVPRLAAYAGLVELTVRLAFRGVCMRPSIVHCHDYVVLPAGWLVSMLVGSSIIYDAHELESERNGMSLRASRLCLFIERWCWRRVSLLVSVSAPILEWYASNLGPKRSVLVLNAPVLPLPSEGDTEGSRRSLGHQKYFHRRFNIPAEAPVFIYLGYLMRGRGIERVLDVFRRPGLCSHVVFMGNGDAVGVADHAKQFPRIHHHSAVPHDQVVKLVREADCGLCLIEDVSLSDRLCLPNKLFEYAFAGVPVLASRLPEIARMVEEFRLGICCDNDADSIEAAVRRIEREGIVAPSGDLTELSWETQAKRLQEAYRVLLAGREWVAVDQDGER